jgi:hypothetical protein
VHLLPSAEKLSPSSWDVTRYTASRRGLGAGPWYGYLLTGTITSVDDLTAEDNSRCLSTLSNIRLAVTYTIPPRSCKQPTPVR